MSSIKIWTERADKIEYNSSMPIGKLEYNRLNPRCTDVIPEKELKLDELCNSILEVGGIIVPLVVFPQKDKFIVLDGERRLRAAKKLGMRTVPVNIISAALNDSENLSRMFNIHLQREQWNTAARAVSLGRLEMLLPQAGVEQIKTMAAMDDNEYNNAKKILSFPKELQERAVGGELNPNYLIEMAKALENLKKHFPDVLEEYGRGKIIDKWILKVDRKVIRNNTHFRILGRICRNLYKEKAVELIKRLIEDDYYKFEEAWDETEEEMAVAFMEIFESKCKKFVRDLHQLPLKVQSPGEIDEIQKILKTVISEVQKKLSEIDKITG